MKLSYKLLIVTAFMCCSQLNASNVSGREKFRNGYERFDASIRRFLMGGMDSTYVGVPTTSWEVPVMGKVYGYQNSIFPESGKVDLNTPAMFEAGLGIGYHGLDLVYTFAVGSNKMDFNFEFDYYDNYWGLGINIGRQNYAGDIFGDPRAKDTEISSRAILLDGYYAVFGNRFSYPSSIYGNYIQKKSAGSPMINFWYEHRDYWAVTPRAQEIFNSMGQSHFNEGAITAGYGYNISVLQGRAVFTLSAGAGLLLPYFGLATNARIGGMVWISEHARFSFALTNFYQKSWNAKDLKMENNTWRGTFGVFYCFGKM